ncbi:unnamed protein product [Rhizophagus irregularis]|nr:unnamed protein product [Rhizophagus irregularis]
MKPYSLPFDKYLAPNLNGERNIDIKVETPIVSDTYTYDKVAKKITENSVIGKLPDGTSYGLDETQAKALIYALTREIALIEGPPGTAPT